MTPSSFDSKIRRLGFTLQLSHCPALCYWVSNFNINDPVSSSATMDNKGTSMVGFLGKCAKNAWHRARQTVRDQSTEVTK